MSLNYPNDVRYAKTDEWARYDGELVVVGVSDYAQDALSDVVFVELPALGDVVAAGDEVVTVESVKAAAEVVTPVSGEVVAVNAALEDTPELINTDPYGEAWFFKVKPSDLSELDALLDAAAYEAYNAEREDH
ncbi:MAG: glycine cleavage system protein GcvH [Chloroflexi bacterium]|nr:glycine cleavage system protein GcvH [Chloroflexota bacterium]